MESHSSTNQSIYGSCCVTLNNTDHHIAWCIRGRRPFDKTRNLSVGNVTNVIKERHQFAWLTQALRSFYRET